MEDELLRNRIVIRIDSKDVREKLLSDADLNLDKSVQIYLACKSAVQQLKNIIDNTK